MEKLKPCPFCGSGPQKNYVDYIGDNFVNEWGIMCMDSNCPVQPDTILYKNLEEAIRAWNTRING